MTPLQRPTALGDQLTLTEEEAATIAEQERLRQAQRQEASDPNREAPPAGGDGSPGAAGNVGGYNSFWIDRGNAAFQIDGEWRTSIIYEPENGRQKLADRIALFRPNTGEAWWVEVGDGSGPYDDMELRPLAERCLLGFSSTSGPPMLPALYNNMKRIVQTDETVVILVEMVHDARIIRMNGEHDPPEIRSGWETRSGTGRGIRWSSTRPTSPTGPDSRRLRRTSTSSSGSREIGMGPSTISSRWMTPQPGPPPGAESICGGGARSACSSMPVTRRTTPSLAS